MGLYIRYEFVTIDRPLSSEQLEELRGISTRAEITPSSFTNDYSWSDLKACPSELMARYFDAGLRWTSAGDRCLFFRLPYSARTHRALKAYCLGETMGVRRRGEYLVVDIGVDDERYDCDGLCEWSLGSLMQLRAALLAGDLRATYLAWLAAVGAQGFMEEKLDDELEEPTLPPGLGELDGALEALVEFLELDRDLLAAAAEGSAERHREREALEQWVRSLPSKQQLRWLLRAVEQPQLALGAQMEASFHDQSPVRAPPPRTLGELRARAELICEQREREQEAVREREQAAREAEREQELRRLRRRWAASWKRLEQLVDDKDYEQAAALTLKLRDADLSRRAPDFQQRLTSMKQRTGRRRGYWQRVNARL